MEPNEISSGYDDMGKYMEVRGYLNEGTKRGVELLERQNNVLEEVDELVELMAVEKETMSREINKLKYEQKDLLDRENMLGSENTKLKLENINKQSMLAVQEEQEAKVTGALKDVMELTKKQLHESRSEVDCLAGHLSKARERSDSLASENLDLKDRIKKLKSDCSTLSTALEIQRTENMKLTRSLTSARDLFKQVQVDNNFLKGRESELEERVKMGEDTILAMKGRATNHRKMEEQLRFKCASLERDLVAANSRPAPRMSQAEKTRIELELLRECKKKNEAMTNYSNQLSASLLEQKKMRLQKNKLERALNSERRKTIRLTREVDNVKKEREVEERDLRHSVEETKELRKKLRKSLTDLRVAKQLEKKINTGKQEVESTIYHVEDQLKRAKDEVTDMRCEMEVKEGRWYGEKQRMEKEKRDLMKAHSKEIGRMRQHLEAKCVLEDDDGETEQLLEDAKEDYRRLKEASTRRCTELAKEVWRLKAMIPEREISDPYSYSNPYSHSNQRESSGPFSHTHHTHKHVQILNCVEPPCLTKCQEYCM